MKEVENESRKMGLDILNKINSVADAQYPVGYVYTQYSGQTAPALLFGGTWTDITATSLPTQIYDSGSNANGSWIRYTDGTMMQWGTTLAVASGIGTSYAGTTAGNLNFSSNPVTFLTSPAFSSAPIVTVANGNRGWNFIGGAYSSTTSGCIIRLADNASWVGATYSFSWIAIGEWSSAPVYPVTLWKRTGGSLTTTTGTSVVTGIYDSGTNSNGSWIRFTDGTMMQWGNFASTTYPQAMTFPIPFVDTTYRLIPAHSESATANIVSNIAPTTVTVSGCSVYSNVGSTAGQKLTGTVDWHAMGFWK
jgi:hypothetical protein